MSAKRKIIKLDKNWDLSPDHASWMLTFTDVKVGEGQNKKGNVKDIVVKRYTYHANLKQALVRYCNEALKPMNTVEELLAKVQSLQEYIESLDVVKLKEKLWEE